MTAEISAVIAALIAAFSAVVLFIIQPASKENAKRQALHELEPFCPPSWEKVKVEDAETALSEIYKHLQYASRGRSFLISRAAVWEMQKILDGFPEKGRLINMETAKELYIWKTLIACALGAQIIIPFFPHYSQKRFGRRLSKVINQTEWVLIAYNKMHMEDDNNLKNEVKQVRKKLHDFEKRLLCSSYFDEMNYLIPILLIGMPILWGIINFPPS